MAKAKSITQPAADNEFNLDGKQYKFIIQKFSVPGFEEGTPLEAKTNENLLRYLVAEKTSIIEETV